MQLKALFVSLSKSRVSRLIAAIEAEAAVELVPVHWDERDAGIEDLTGDFDAVFINRGLDAEELQDTLKRIRATDKRVPVVLAYEVEPDGRAFVLAKRYGCWLFSEIDRLQRGLTPGQLGEALVERADDRNAHRRLFEISLCTGPCSTGD